MAERKVFNEKPCLGETSRFSEASFIGRIRRAKTKRTDEIILSLTHHDSMTSSVFHVSCAKSLNKQRQRLERSVLCSSKIVAGKRTTHL